jgi:hypothetical protein
VIAAAREIGPTCGPDEHCITCGDEGVPMRVLVDGDDGLAVCRREAESPSGAPLESVVDVALVGAVRPGDLVLVHAGIALLLLDETGAVA